MALERPLLSYDVLYDSPDNAEPIPSKIWEGGGYDPAIANLISPGTELSAAEIEMLAKVGDYGKELLRHFKAQDLRAERLN